MFSFGVMEHVFDRMRAICLTEFIETYQRIHLCTGDDPLHTAVKIFLCERYPEAHLTPSSMGKKQHIYNSVREADGQTTEDSDTETERNGTERF